MHAGRPFLPMSLDFVVNPRLFSKEIQRSTSCPQLFPRSILLNIVWAFEAQAGVGDGKTEEDEPTAASAAIFGFFAISSPTLALRLERERPLDSDDGAGASPGFEESVRALFVFDFFAVLEVSSSGLALRLEREERVDADDGVRASPGFGESMEASLCGSRVPLSSSTSGRRPGDTLGEPAGERQIDIAGELGGKS